MAGVFTSGPCGVQAPSAQHSSAGRCSYPKIARAALHAFRINVQQKPVLGASLRNNPLPKQDTGLVAAASAEAATSTLPLFEPKEPWDPNRLSMIIANMFEEHGGRVMHINFFNTDVYTTRDPKDFAFVQKHTESFTKNPTVRYKIKDWLGFRNILFEPDVVAHASMRAMVQPAFRADNLKNHMPSFAVTGDRLADVLLASAGEELDVMDLCKRTTADVFGWVGLQYKLGNLSIAASKYEMPMASRDDEEDLVADFDEVMNVAKKLIVGIAPDNIPDYNNYVEGTKRINAMVGRVLAKRRARNDWQEGDDILAFILREQAAHGELTDEDIANQVGTFLVAGEDTTAITLAFTFRSLAEFPEWQERVAAEVRAVLDGRSPAQLRHEELKSMPVLTACINETLRLYAPVAAVGRMCIQDTVVNGLLIPKGVLVNLNIYSMHRDPSIWPRPEEWLPQRWLPEGKEELFSRVGMDAFQPFSTGSRSCIGRNFAYIEAQVVAAAVIDKVQLENVAERIIQLEEPFTLNSAGGVWIKAFPRP